MKKHGLCISERNFSMPTNRMVVTLEDPGKDEINT
jgi:hypothetical protein